MAIAPNAYQNPAEVLNGLVWFLLIGAFTYAVMAVAARAWAAAPARRRPDRARRRTRCRVLPPLSLLGLLVTPLSPALAQRRSAAPPFRRLDDASAPPWSATSGFPPPRSLVRTRAPEIHTSHDGAHRDRGAHPAVHPEGAGAGTVIPLFPRSARPQHDSDEARARAMSQHPAGRAWCGRGVTRYTVRSGDTLWDIAATHLGTSDVARVARYWPRIHRANRSAIGPDPSLILPGTVLDLPCE